MNRQLKMRILTILLTFCLLPITTTSFAITSDDSELLAVDPFYVNSASGQGPPMNSLHEEIDPFSGHLKIIQTDVELPGAGGLNLKLMRVYNSNIWGRRDYTNTASESFSVIRYASSLSSMGIGWSMHMGIVRNPLGKGSYVSGTEVKHENPVVEMPDGSQHILYKSLSSSDTYVSRENWIYKKNSGSSTYQDCEWTLTLNDGTVYTFRYNRRDNGKEQAGYRMGDNDTENWVAQATKITNPSKTRFIKISYSVNNSYPSYSYISKISQPVHDTNGEITNREIYFYYTTAASGYSYRMLTSIKIIDGSTGDREYKYRYGLNIKPTNGPPYFYLTEVQRPTGNPWKYSYETSQRNFTYSGLSHTGGQLRSCQYPQGGKITYGYRDVTFSTGKTNVKFRVIRTKETSGGNIKPGKWTYYYSSGSSAGDTRTIIAEGDSKVYTEKYLYLGWGNVGSGSVWKVGIPINKYIYLNDDLIESEAYIWHRGTIISNDILANRFWKPNPYTNITDKYIIDSAVYNTTYMTSKTVSRDGKDYVTTFSDQDSYGNPRTIKETGEGSRETNINYNYSTCYFTGLPKTKTIFDPSGIYGGSFTTTYEYYSPGYIKSEDRSGVKTSYTYEEYLSTPTGDLKTVTDPNNHTISYTWAYGSYKTITNQVPFTIENEIWPDGMVRCTKNGRGYTTYYEYDKNLYPTKIVPPLGNPIIISYPEDGSYSYAKTTRGAYYSYEYFDGLGRSIGTSDKIGVVTNTIYKAMGLKDYITSNIGDTIYYDYFSRIDKIIHHDNNSIDFSYSKGTVTIKDEADKTKVLTYKAFGTPDEKFLSSVKEPGITNLTYYSYNILGSLTKILKGTLSRQFLYDNRNFLYQEMNPETGIIKYTRYNSGLLKTKTDANGTTEYFYDEIDRLINTKSENYQLNFAYDNANNLEVMSSPSSNLGFEYDASNRMIKKSLYIFNYAYLTSYNYDGNDNLDDISYPSGRFVDYVNNDKNQVIEIKETKNNSVVNRFIYDVKYNIVGQPISYISGDGLSHTLEYNKRLFNTLVKAGNTLNIGYEPDSRGNTKKIFNNLDSSRNQIFEYDDINRITTFLGPWGSGYYTYYDNGNRKTKELNGSISTYNYDNTTNRLMSTIGWQPAAFEYNPDGSISSGSWITDSYSFEYDAFQNLKSVKKSGNYVAKYLYTANGIRVSKTTSEGAIVYHYDQNDNVLSESNSNGTFIADYIYFNGKLLAKIENERKKLIKKPIPRRRTK